MRVPPGGGDAEVIETRPLHFPNGLAIASDEAVYLLESFTPRLSVLRDGRLETIVDLPGTVPDGVALLAGGGFVIACYYPFWILHVSTAGDVETMLDDKAGIYFPMPTNVSFFGPELKSMAIAMLGGWSIRAIDLPVAGVPLTYPEL